MLSDDERVIAQDERSALLHDLAIGAGYEVCGIVGIDETADFAYDLERRFVAEPDSASFYGEGIRKRAHMREAYPWANSIVVVGYWYGRYRVPKELRGHYGKSYLADARKDEASEEWQCRQRFVAAMEGHGFRNHGDRLNDVTCFRKCAEKAGLGIVRENNFLYIKRGSYVYLDAWVLEEDLRVRYDVPLAPCPPDCGRCRKACGTKTLRAPHVMNPLTCTARLSCFRLAELAEHDLAPCMRGWIYGCDDCQDACPFNQRALRDMERMGDEFPGLEQLVDIMSPEGILRASDEELEALVQPKLWYVGEGEAWQFRMGALNALANAEEGDRPEDWEELLEASSRHPRQEVRAMVARIRSGVPSWQGANDS